MNHICYKCNNNIINENNVCTHCENNVFGTCDIIIDESLKTNNFTKFNYKDKHIDFVVGRGRNNPIGYMNIPLNNNIKNRNIIFIDPNPVMDSDIHKSIKDVDFSQFNILHNQDINRSINIRIIFDWSSFYCTAIYDLPNVIRNIGRNITILVPLSKNENNIPTEIYYNFNDPSFNVSLKNGKYPLFDWSKNHKEINQNHYIQISCYE